MTGHAQSVIMRWHILFNDLGGILLCRVGRFEIQAEIGQGGGGQVFRAFDSTVNRVVAIKILTSTNSADSLRRFRYEASAAGNLHHPNIVTVYEFGEEGKLPYLAMEYLEGQDLQNILKKGTPYTILQKVEIMTQVAEGLQHAHRSGVLHRDVKPANIMVLKDGSVKIMDFGIARVMHEDQTRMPQKGFLNGTIHYMAPELLTGSDVNLLCDIWAYGVIYREFLSGKNPFEASTQQASVYKIVHEDPASLPPDICPEALQPVLNRLLSKDPELRYQTFEDVLFDTQPILTELRRERAQALLTNAQAACESGKWEEALQVIRSILALDGQNKGARKLRERVQYELHRRSIAPRTEDQIKRGEDDSSSRLPNGTGTLAQMQTSYDTVVYPGYAYPQTHPDHVAVMARLCGLDPAPVETCRVLEIGCGDAANLIPMAAGLPQANFRGFDLAASSIERGRAFASELGLTNLALEHLDICDAPDRMGEFDYIIAHGFYSWVPKPVRDKLMAICRASLAPQGVAFISYNTFPGGHIRQMIREIMLFHVDRAPDAQTRTSQARALLGFLSKLNAGEDEYEHLLKAELERVLKYHPAHLFHDDLAPIFDCFYLHEFIAHAAEYDLQFLSDLNSSFIHVQGLDGETTRALSELASDPILREQYLDFACCRRFRQTLLCHASLPVTRELNIHRMKNLLFSSPATPTSQETDLSPNIEEEFKGARNACLKTDHPMVKAAMLTLNSVWPQRLSLNELRARVAARLQVSLDSIPVSLLCEGITAAFMLRVLDLHVYSPNVSARPSHRPRASAMARLQSKRGTLLTNLLHQSVKVEGDAQQILSLLDGQRDREALAAELQLSTADIDEVLAGLARLALLES